MGHSEGRARDNLSSDWARCRFPQGDISRMGERKKEERDEKLTKPSL